MFVIVKDRMKEVVQSEQELILYVEIRHGPVLFKKKYDETARVMRQKEKS